VVRTFATAMADAVRMDLRRFAVYSLVGGFAATRSGTLLDYWLGQVTAVGTHVGLSIVGIVALSLLPVVIGGLRRRRSAWPRRLPAVEVLRSVRDTGRPVRGRCPSMSASSSATARMPAALG
jgi:membrane protein DedA with SNARE-associated domain